MPHAPPLETRAERRPAHLHRRPRHGFGSISPPACCQPTWGAVASSLAWLVGRQGGEGRGGGRRARGRRKAGRAGGEISRARGRSVGGQVPAGRFEAVTVLSRKFHQTIPFRILSFIIKSLKRDYLNFTHVLQFDLEIMRSKQGDLSSRIYFKINHNVLIFGLLLLGAQLVSCFGLRVNLIS